MPRPFSVTAKLIVAAAVFIAAGCQTAEQASSSPDPGNPLKQEDVAELVSGKLVSFPSPRDGAPLKFWMNSDSSLVLIARGKTYKGKWWAEKPSKLCTQTIRIRCGTIKKSQGKLYYVGSLDTVQMTIEDQ